MDNLLAEATQRLGLHASDGVQVMSPTALLRRPFDPGLALVLLPDATAATSTHDPDFEPDGLPGRQAHAGDAVELLRSMYPPDHPMHGLAGAGDTTVERIAPAELEARAYLLPAVPASRNVASLHGLTWLVARLRAPGGCPWDREQDHLSLRPYLLEEAYEVYDALEHGSTPQLAEELGDLLLQVVLHAHYGAEAGVFDMTDVTRATMTKIIRRHPHVFGDVVAGTSDEVVRNWEQIKSAERAEAPKKQDRDMPAAFAGLSRSLPALAYAQEMQGRAAALGYDWPSVDGVLEKVAEEAAELAAAAEDAARREELGDLLLVIVNLARRLGVDAEGALRSASAKFAGRFAAVERLAAERGVELRAQTLEELDDLWREAKQESLEGAR
jgi:MazG family protein